MAPRKPLDPSPEPPQAGRGHRLVALSASGLYYLGALRHPPFPARLEWEGFIMQLARIRDTYVLYKEVLCEVKSNPSTAIPFGGKVTRTGPSGA